MRIFEFVTVSGTQPRGDAGSRRQIRSHAQADYNRRHPRARRQRDVELDISSLTADLAVAPWPHEERQVFMPGPTSFLGASRADPFATFNIGDSPRSRQLWDHGK